MKHFVLSLALILTGLEAQARVSVRRPSHPAPPHRQVWSCQATDYQGSFGDGVSEDKQEAQLQALDRCQQRSRGLCTVTGCLPH